MNGDPGNLPSLKTRLLAVGAALAVAILAALAALWVNDARIDSLSDDSRQQLAPRIIERQRAAINLERLIRFGWITATAARTQEWRSAAKAAQALSFHPSLTFDPELAKEAESVHDMIRKVLDLREQAHLLRQQAAQGNGADEPTLLAQAVEIDSWARGLWTPQEAKLSLIELTLGDDAARMTVDRFAQIAHISRISRGWGFAAAAAILATLLVTGLIIHRSLFAPVHRIAQAMSKTLDRGGAPQNLPKPATHEIAIIQDAAFRLKSALEQSADREARLSAILAASVAGVVVTDSFGNILQANGAFIDLLGYPADELARLSFRDVTHPDDLAREEPLLADLLPGTIDQYRLDKRYRRRDGSWLWADLSVSALRGPDGMAQMFVGVAVDISDRVRAEQELLFIQALVDKSAEPIYCVDPLNDGRMVWANSAAATHFGVPMEKLLSMKVSDWNVRLDGPSIKEVWQRLRDGETKRTFESLHRRADGTVVPVEVSLAWIDHDGKSYCSSHARDLSERNRMLEAVRRSNEDLQQFAYVASHDLQEPLRMVASFLQLLDRRFGPELNDEAREYIQFAVDGAVRMKRLIEDLLEYSRVETRGHDLMPVRLDAVLDMVLSNLAALIVDADAEVSVPAFPVTLTGDLGQLARLFQNLIGNALKYRHPDRPARIAITASRDDGMWRLSVKDNGIGIAPEYHERIFLIFQRLHGPSTYEGTGIGLAICKRIAERHGGSISVKSEEGAGAEFILTMPAAPGVTPGAGPAIPAGPG